MQVISRIILLYIIMFCNDVDDSFGSRIGTIPLDKNVAAAAWIVSHIYIVLALHEIDGC